VLRTLAPDVVCIQESPRFFRWRTKVARLARESGLVYVTGGRASGAQVLLADVGVDVREAREIKLSKRFGLHQRGLALAEFRKADQEFAVASIHLGLVAGERRTHVEEVLGHLADVSTGPQVLAGDFNEIPGAPVVERLRSAGWQDGWQLAPSGGELTFSAKNPRRRIDYVFVRPGITVRGCGVPSEAPGLAVASDHLPVLAALELTRQESPGR
jgi:endonuclease/exonuclease/phosphatase family metal-dependent hydrolase